MMVPSRRYQACVLLSLIVNVASFHYLGSTVSSIYTRTTQSNLEQRPRHSSITELLDFTTNRNQNKELKAGLKAKPNKKFFTRTFNHIAIETQDDLRTVFMSLFVAIFVKVLLFEPRFIPSLSMFPTFDIGDQLLVDKVSHFKRPYSRKDVIVFEPSENYIDMTGNTNALIKRVVAVAGDTVEVKNCILFVNGVPQSEPYINEEPDYILSLQVVPPGMLMMLGDNRNHSFDSHIWGFLPEKNVIGRAIVKYWPLERIGFIEGSD